MLSLILILISKGLSFGMKWIFGAETFAFLWIILAVLIGSAVYFGQIGVRQKQKINQLMNDQGKKMEYDGSYSLE